MTGLRQDQVKEHCAKLADSVIVRPGAGRLSLTPCLLLLAAHFRHSAEAGSTVTDRACPAYTFKPFPGLLMTYSQIFHQTRLPIPANN